MTVTQEGGKRHGYALEVGDGGVEEFPIPKQPLATVGCLRWETVCGWYYGRCRKQT